MQRPRPHIPLAVRIKVAEGQIAKAGRSTVIFENQPLDKQLAGLLAFLFGIEPVALDHNPPLRARPYNPRIKNVAARYTPNANDPDFLIYRTVEDHKLKTNVRGDGAQYPDRVLIKRERKRERKAKTKTPPPTSAIAKTWNLHPCRWCGRIHVNGCGWKLKRKRRWPSRPFPPGRGFQSKRQ